MKTSLLCALVAVTAQQATVEGFVSSFAPSHGVSQPQGSRYGRSSVRMFFGGPSGVMPKLYEGWFKKTGQIEKDIVAGAKSALRGSAEEVDSVNGSVRGVVREVITPAPAGAQKPKKGQKVTVHCTGYGKNRDLSQKFWSTKDAGQ
ncbi:unnamed protein product, partial [Ectocarpus sp. 12 AP-2014]